LSWTAGGAWLPLASPEDADLSYGDLDSTVNTPADLRLLHLSVPALYDTIPGAQKLMFRIACAGHQIVRIARVCSRAMPT